VRIEDTPLQGVKVLTPNRIGDSRGFFAESYNYRVLTEFGIEIEFVQDNHSLSSVVGTVRGLHFQCPPSDQGKLVRCGRGALYDVVVDIRLGSPTYGKWYGIDLTFENGRQLLVPAGFAHGFITRQPDTEIVYKCSNYYAPEAEGSLLWNDPVIGIDWNIDSDDALLSEKDLIAPKLSDLVSPFLYEAST
jgi:dTDP-4-dehydrorhamnose 3,5-epimerase